MDAGDATAIEPEAEPKAQLVLAQKRWLLRGTTVAATLQTGSTSAVHASVSASFEAQAQFEDMMKGQK